MTYHALLDACDDWQLALELLEAPEVGSEVLATWRLRSTPSAWRWVSPPCLCATPLASWPPWRRQPCRERSWGGRFRRWLGAQPHFRSYLHGLLEVPQLRSLVEKDLGDGASFAHELFKDAHVFSAANGFVTSLYHRFDDRAPYREINEGRRSGQKLVHTHFRGAGDRLERVEADHL